jgi:hypothetical protein
MKNKIKISIAAALGAVYLAIGSWFGWAVYISLPALNLAGAAYIAVTWPAQLKGSPVHPPVAYWMFTFKD